MEWSEIILWNSEKCLVGVQIIRASYRKIFGPLYMKSTPLYKKQHAVSLYLVEKA